MCRNTVQSFITLKIFAASFFVGISKEYIFCYYIDRALQNKQFLAKHFSILYHCNDDLKSMLQSFTDTKSV